MMGETLKHAKLTVLSARGHLSFRIDFEDSVSFAKVFADKPSAAAMRFRLPNALPAIRRSHAIYCASIFCGSLQVSPRILKADGARCALTTEWLPNRPPDRDLLTLSRMVQGGILEYEEFGKGLVTARATEAFLRALGEFWKEQNQLSLSTLDLAGARLNAVIYGDQRQFFRSHPQVELIRTDNLLKFGGLGKSMPDFAATVSELRAIFCEEEDLHISPITLCHGDVKPSHLRQRASRLKLLDPEELHFAVGELDLGHWSFYACYREARPRADGEAAVNLLRTLLPDQRRYSSSVAWMVAQACFSALGRAVGGNLVEVERITVFLREASRRYVATRKN